MSVERPTRKNGNSYSQICFPNFLGKKEQISLILTYYHVPYNCGLYGKLFLIVEQLHHLPYFFRGGCESEAPPANTNSSTNFNRGGAPSLTIFLFLEVARAKHHWLA